MSSHLLDRALGKCLACGVEFGDHGHPGPFFRSPAPWSLHHDRCKPGVVAFRNGAEMKFVPLDHEDNHYPGPGKPAGPWKERVG